MSNNQNILPTTGERLLTAYKNKTAVEHLHRYSVAKDYVKNKTVLDIASGEGYGSNLLSKAAKFVYGVDISKDAVNHANKKYKKDNLTFLEGSAAKIPLDDHCIDVLVSFETIEHHDQHEEMMKECKRVLKQDGILIISSPDKKYFSDIPQYKNEYHVKELYKDEFHTLVSSYFSNVTLYKQGISMGSILYNEKSTESTVLRLYSGDYDNVYQMEDINNPNFNLIIASNSNLNVSPNSYFESDFVNADLIGELANYRSMYETVLASTSYKIARIMMLPFRAFSKIFRK